MKLGAVTFLAGDRIPLPEGVTTALGLKPGCSLGIGFWTSPEEAGGLDAVELVVSAIPVGFWRHAYEVNIPLDHRLGTSAKAAKALAGLGANIIQCESTAMGLMRTGYWTAIVEFVSGKRGVPTPRQFRNKLIKENRKKPDGGFLPHNREALK